MIFINKKKSNNNNNLNKENNFENLFENSFFKCLDNDVYIDYPYFKNIISINNDDNNILIIDKLFNIIEDCIKKDKNYNIHLNLESFTITSLEKHKNIIELFLRKIENKIYINLLNNIFIYNTPKSLTHLYNIMNWLINETQFIKNKTVLYNKKDSAFFIKKIIESKYT